VVGGFGFIYIYDGTYDKNLCPLFNEEREAAPLFLPSKEFTKYESKNLSHPALSQYYYSTTKCVILCYPAPY
jgi:hypothetical protein